MTEPHTPSKLSRVLFVVRVAVTGLLLALLAVPAAQAQDTGTYRSGPLDWGQERGRAWVDFNADGKADYCRLDAASRPLCTLATGRGFGTTVTGEPADPGYLDDRLWGDVDGNGGADYCRRVGDAGREGFACTLSTAFTFVGASQLLTWGETNTAALADVTGDGKRDYCRLTADRALCSAWEPGFGPGFGSAVLAVGDLAGRAWVDFNADGRADLCRVASGTLACTLSTGSGFGGTIVSATDDVGYPDGRAFVDVDGDRRADYCRRVGGAPPDTYIRCTLATPTGFDGANFTSARIEWGDTAGTAWVDFDADGDRDFCRPVAPSATNAQLFCTLWTPAGLGPTIVSGPTDVGYADTRAWVDHNGDGRADYCRTIGGGADPGISCTTSIGTAFGPVPEPAPPAPPAPPPPPPAPPAPTPKTRLVVTLSYDYSVKGRWTRITRLQVKGVPAGATVKATCRKGCSRKSYSVKKRARGTASLDRVVRKRLRAGTKVRVVVSRPGNLAAIKTLTIRASKRPTVKTG
ncbi:VCBS repeat-containing protein [Solirubrobacter sp. CPCC 204708]|nr:VCBS repeat-containing protein [Solirubrobacter deserti]